MITTTISLKPYLAEYLKGIYNNGADEPINIPDNTDLYHTIWQLMAKRPSHISGKEEGNLTIILPDRRIGKDPAFYNYLSMRSQKIIEKRVKGMFDAELHERIEENQNEGAEFTRLEVVHIFMKGYGIDSITEDALLKNYSRWKDTIRKKKKRRDYKRKLKTA